MHFVTFAPFLLAFAATAVASPASFVRKSNNRAASSAYATVINFNTADLLNGYDGMPPSPFAPWKYGQPTVTLTQEGKVMEQHDTSISYFNGTYYLYTEKWACGLLNFFSGLIANVSTVAPSYPPGDYGGLCGVGIYSSKDLTSWKTESEFAFPNATFAKLQKPHVVYSKSTGKYVFWFKSGSNFVETGGLWVATSDTPVGPWSTPTQATGLHLAHDFDLAKGPDGTYYVVSDVYSAAASTDRTKPPLWNVWIQQLNPALTGTVGTNDTITHIMTDVDFEGIGLFYNNGHWYITSGGTCANCAVPTSYIMSSNGPLGPYVNEAGHSSADGSLTEGTVISTDGCTGQSKANTVLPTDNGQVVIGTSFAYRTSPGNYAPQLHVSHGNNAQAIASTSYFPISFDSNFHIVPYTCPSTVQIPLKSEATTRQPSVPVVRQPDCRITSSSSILQTYQSPLTVSSLRIPVWQQTFDQGPFAQAGPVNNGDLTITVENQAHRTISQTIAASNVSWSPEVVTIDLSSLKGAVRSIRFTSSVTNGCYGTVVEPATNGASSGTYSVVLPDGASIAAPQARLTTV